MEKLTESKLVCMKKITLLLCFLLAILFSANAQKTGMFDGNEDVGNPAKKEQQIIIPNQEYTMTCGGRNMWANNDQFRFLWNKIKGDFMISATVDLSAMAWIRIARSVSSQEMSSLLIHLMRMQCAWRWFNLSTIQACRHCPNCTNSFTIQRRSQYRTAAKR